MDVLSKSFLFDILGGIFVGFGVNLMTTILLNKSGGLAIAEEWAWAMSFLLLFGGLYISLGKAYLRTTIETISKEAKKGDKDFKEMMSDGRFKRRINAFMFLILLGALSCMSAIVLGLIVRQH